jgi:predicted AlkP superfamily pyrophosphatase or phosphodiesterase
MVSFDGLRADYLVEADRYGLRIPTLRMLMRRGCVAREMITIFPSVTYPAHVTLITGHPPARHGIYDNERFQPLIDRHADWYWSARDVQVPTLLDAFSEVGRKTAAIGWPVTVDARADLNFPEAWDAKNFNTTFVARSRAAATPGLLEAAEKVFDFRFDLENLDEHRNLVARHVVRAHRPDLILLHYNELDKKQHRLGPAVPEVFNTLEKLDGLLGELIEEYAQSNLADRLVTFIVSDHGFERVDRMFKPNVILRDAGLIEYDSANQRVRSWRAKAWVSGASAAILTADPLDHAAADAARRALEAHVGPGEAIARIIEKGEIRRLGSNPHASFMMDASPGWMLSGGSGGSAQEAAPIHGMHGQMPDRPELAAGFIACGPGVPPGRTLDRMTLIEVAPTLAALSGVQLPATTGRSLWGAP